MFLPLTNYTPGAEQINCILCRQFFLSLLLLSFAVIFSQGVLHTCTHFDTHHSFPLLLLCAVQVIGWISCAIPYGGLSCWIWSQWWMKEPMSHHRFVLLYLLRSAVAHLPRSLCPSCQAAYTMPFKLSLPCRSLCLFLPHVITVSLPPLFPFLPLYLPRWMEVNVWASQCSLRSKLSKQSVPTSLSFMNISWLLCGVMANFSHLASPH